MASDNIHVAIRLRPRLLSEQFQQSHWKVENKNVIFQVTDNYVPVKNSSFTFDRVFNENETNIQVYKDLCEPIVYSVMDGVNGTVFAYGQTASGKTFTMSGDSSNPGIIPQAIRNIFYIIENIPEKVFLLRVSYLEIYNDALTDLLDPSNSKTLKITENTEKQISIVNLTEVVVRSEEEVLHYFEKGENNKRIGETTLNSRSSRSHTIFRMIIESRSTDGEVDERVRVSQLNLVDLAGSEPVAAMGNTGERFKEGVFVNLSLLALGQTISNLLSKDRQFINYRQSKLTRILQNSLGGNARTAFVCTVTPTSTEQTYSTLKFASRAKCIENRPIVNEVMNETALLKQYAQQVQKLNLELQRLKETKRVPEVETLSMQLKQKEDVISELEKRLKDVKEKLVISSHTTADLTKNDAAGLRKFRRETWCPSTIAANLDGLPLPSILQASQAHTRETQIIQEEQNELSATSNQDLQNRLGASACFSMNEVTDTSFYALSVSLREAELAEKSCVSSSLDAVHEETSVQTKQVSSVCVSKDSAVQTDNFSASVYPNLSQQHVSVQTVDFQNQEHSKQFERLQQDYSALKKEYDELQLSTTLEKQMLAASCEICASKPSENCANGTKSVRNRDGNELASSRYSQLQDEEVNMNPCFQKKLNSIIVEKVNLEFNLSEAEKKVRELSQKLQQCRCFEETESNVYKKLTETLLKAKSYEKMYEDEKRKAQRYEDDYGRYYQEVRDLRTQNKLLQSKIEALEASSAESILNDPPVNAGIADSVKIEMLQHHLYQAQKELQKEKRKTKELEKKEQQKILNGPKHKYFTEPSQNGSLMCDATFNNLDETRHMDIENMSPASGFSEHRNMRRDIPSRPLSELNVPIIKEPKDKQEEEEFDVDVGAMIRNALHQSPLVVKLDNLPKEDYYNKQKDEDQCKQQ